ncbi:MAG TPA: hypothetical protein GXZ24_07130 [Firmicutes bacterium]|nr:hypothetical protein [Bacillota bacterium]
MYPYQQALADDVKREVLAELRRGSETNMPRGTGARYRPGSYPPPVTDKAGQAIRDSVKNEILAEIQAQRADQMAQAYGLGNTLSDHRIQQAIDARYRTIDNMKEDIKKELLAMQKIETQRARDPHISQIAGTLAEEARRQGIPLEQVMQSLDQKTLKNPGMMGKLTDMINTGQRKGFLFGIGAACLIYLLWPSAKNNLRSVAVRSVEEGMSMVDRAKTFVKGHPAQNIPGGQDPPADFSNIAPVPPPDINPPPDAGPPPDGDNTVQ